MATRQARKSADDHLSHLPTWARKLAQKYYTRTVSTFLLTGDIESRTERALLVAGDDLRADALKVAHHGSRTSSTDGLVAAAHPALAVVSVARDSPYGHPHAEVLARWRDAGAQVLTTAERGMVTVSTDGEDLKVETFVGP